MTTDEAAKQTATVLAQVQADVRDIKVALLGPFGQGGGALDHIDEALKKATKAETDAAAANALAGDNRKRLNALSSGNAIYTTVAAVIAGGIGWLGGAR